jgi:threonine dehydrogenase-like Zn-dependent dehydrogenase
VSQKFTPGSRKRKPCFAIGFEAVKYCIYLRDATLVSHELPLDEAAEAYEHFDKRENGWTKVVLKPAAKHQVKRSAAAR